MLLFVHATKDRRGKLLQSADNSNLAFTLDQISSLISHVCPIGYLMASRVCVRSEARGNDATTTPARVCVVVELDHILYIPGKSKRASL